MLAEELVSTGKLPEMSSDDDLRADLGRVDGPGDPIGQARSAAAPDPADPG